MNGETTGRILVPVEEEERRALEAEAAAKFDELFVLDPDMPVRYDPPVHIPRRLPEPKFFHTYDRPRHRSVTKRRIYKSWGRWVVIIGLLLRPIPSIHSHGVYHTGYHMPGKPRKLKLV